MKIKSSFGLYLVLTILLIEHSVAYPKSNEYDSILYQTSIDSIDTSNIKGKHFASVGEGSTSILIYAGLYLHGVIKKDRKSIEVSSQLMQSLLALGFTTQLIKRISGRESPFVATTAGGRWSPLINPVVYLSKVPSYAFHQVFFEVNDRNAFKSY